MPLEDGIETWGMYKLAEARRSREPGCGGELDKTANCIGGGARVQTLFRIRGVSTLGNFLPLPFPGKRGGSLPRKAATFFYPPCVKMGWCSKWGRLHSRVRIRCKKKVVIRNTGYTVCAVYV